MADTQETTADIIAEKRRNFADGNPYYAAGLPDRLESAHKREVGALRQRCTELNAEVAAKDEVIKRLNDAISEEQRRKMATTEKSLVVGDAAKLREAVIGLRDRISMFYKNEWIPYDEWEGANDDANSALAAPPRNCDVYNNESCRMAYYLHGDGLMTMQAFADWLYAPATEKEGGGK